MKKSSISFVSGLAFCVLIAPQIAFAAWWNPLSWNIVSVITSWFSAPQKTTSITVPVSTSASEPITQETPKQTNPNPKTTETTQPQVSPSSQPKQTPKTFTTPSGAVLDENGNVLVPAPTPQVTYPTQAQQDTINQNNRYQQQLQIVQNKVNALQPAYDQYMSACPNPGAVAGNQAVACEASFGQASAVAEYQNALMKNFLTPVTDISIEYEKRLDDISKQIYDTKKEYWRQYTGYATTGTVGFAQGMIKNLTDGANAKINTLNQQWETIYREYQLY
jgi:hypothetical protein